MTTAYAPPPAAPQPAPAVQAFDHDPGNDLGPGGFVMPPAQPAPAGRPAWPSYQQVRPAAPPPQPVYQAPPQPAYQPLAYAQQPPAQPPQIPAPQQPAVFAPTAMPPDPRMAPPRQPYQFTDNIALVGPVGGVPTAATGGTPAGQQVLSVPAGATQPYGQQVVPQYAPPQPAQTVVRDALLAQGLQVSHYRSDQELLADMGETLQRNQQLLHYARLGMAAQVQPQAPPTNQPPASPAQPAPADQPQRPQQPQQPQRQQAPEWRPEWDRMVQHDPRTGLYVAVDPIAVNPVIVERANEYARWVRERSGAMLRDPLTTLRGEGLDELLRQNRDSVKAELRAELAAERAAAESDRARGQFIEQNLQQFFVLDPTTQRPAINPINGQAVMTPRGQAIFGYADQYVDHFRATYGREPVAQDVIQFAQSRLAQDEARGAFGPPLHQPPQQQVPAQYAPVQQLPATVARALAMNGAQWQPSLGGSPPPAPAGIPNPALPPTPVGMDFTQMLRQAGVQRGLLVG